MVTVRTFGLPATGPMAMVLWKLVRGNWTSSGVPNIPSGPGRVMVSGGAPTSSSEPTNPVGLGCKSGCGPTKNNPAGFAAVLLEMAAQLLGLLYFAVKIASAASSAF